MKVDPITVKQFEDLIEFGRMIVSDNIGREYGKSKSGERLQPMSMMTAVSQWGTSSLNLISRVAGDDSIHKKQFTEAYENFIRDQVTYGTNDVEAALGFLYSAKHDYESGLFFDLTDRITADVFDDFLERAEYLCADGDFQAAAVIAGCVLEDGLRKLCGRYPSIALTDKPALDTMNGQLAKAGVYKKYTQKRITALADLRNSAAHGKWNEFSKPDVEKMIPEIREFIDLFF